MSDLRKAGSWFFASSDERRQTMHQQCFGPPGPSNRASKSAQFADVTGRMASLSTVALMPSHGQRFEETDHRSGGILNDRNPARAVDEEFLPHHRAARRPRRLEGAIHVVDVEIGKPVV